MRTVLSVIFLSVTLGLCSSLHGAPAQASKDAQVAPKASPGAKKFERGLQLLRKGKLAASLVAFDAAVSEAPLNKDYAAQGATVRKVLALHNRLSEEKDLAKWVRIARALHLFYHRYDLYDSCLVIDEQIHAKLNNGLSAALLAQTLMAQGKNKEAAELLLNLPEKKRSLGSNTMGIIALARAGHGERAKREAASLAIPGTLCAGKCYLLARMYAAVGDHNRAASLLSGAFAKAPKSRLKAFKAKAKRCPEFAALLADPRYASVMKTVARGTEEDHDHDHGPGGHCVNCPCQDTESDVAAPAMKSSSKKDTSGENGASKSQCDECPNKCKGCKSSCKGNAAQEACGE
jgi:tetratricopeptide (TPR) repeat protein